MANRAVRKERSKFVSFYVSEEEKQRIVEAAVEADLSISDYCRKILLNSTKEIVYLPRRN